MIMGKRNRNRRKANGDSRKLFAWLTPLVQTVAAGGLRPALGVLALMVGLGVMAWGLILSFDRPIGKVEVGGQFQRVAPVQIEEVVAPFRGSGFLSVDLDALRAALETIPWVDRARVERKWPNGVRVFITEHVAAARWGNSGLMNIRGELFLNDATHIPPELPQLVGPPGTETQVARLYLETYPRLLGVGMRLSRVELDARGAWQLTLGNGVAVRLGRQDVPARLERFISVASPVVAARGAEVSYVDLRYSNGFSVGWNASGSSETAATAAATSSNEANHDEDVVAGQPNAHRTLLSHDVSRAKRKQRLKRDVDA
jgi:cell division protein FtsQ